ncbi:MAG: hypothetical protein AVDCRST_MAG12-484, partial [uncultured Rubrobacteraceae bacterium]
ERDARGAPVYRPSGPPGARDDGGGARGAGVPDPGPRRRPPATAPQLGDPKRRAGHRRPGAGCGDGPASVRPLAVRGRTRGGQLRLRPRRGPPEVHAPVPPAWPAHGEGRSYGRQGTRRLGASGWSDNARRRFNGGFTRLQQRPPRVLV